MNGVLSSRARIAPNGSPEKDLPKKTDGRGGACASGIGKTSADYFLTVFSGTGEMKGIFVENKFNEEGLSLPACIHGRACPLCNHLEEREMFSVNCRDKVAVFDMDGTVF